MNYIKQLLIKLALLNARRQLAYMVARKARYGMKMCAKERAWLNRDIYNHEQAIIGYQLWLAEDNETEALSSRCVSPLKRLGE